MQVFERVAHPVVASTLDGFNGTIFAYGQTGSGKTFTITGGAERYVDRGIIPRMIACIYSETAKRAEHTYQVRVHVYFMCPNNQMLLSHTAVVRGLSKQVQVLTCSAFTQAGAGIVS